ncbi:BTAD domain-containing putative transcriptional regulator [Actinoplanes sp. NPDC024001]|uniref:ATP-binding protein n=1 Tax=Actinoplanes sp. NPDC024001 TaxID=3154598 RepID=UPI00340692EE
MTPDLVLLSRVSFRGREITGARLCGLLALLAGDLRTGCGVGRLVQGLWPDEQPANPAKALQILVWRARSQLGADVIVRTPAGYRLALAEEQVDAAAVLVRAEQAAACARAGDHAGALTHADAGLALWDAAAPGDAGTDPVTELRARRRINHHHLVRARALALSRLGRPAEAVDLLAALAADSPRDEELLVELLRCEAATAGPAAALARYEAYRRVLREELGADPGPAAQAEHRRLLRGAAPAVRQGVTYEPNPLLGRDDDIAAVEALLRTSRVTSIVGTGGLGKTRLANAVARRADLPAVAVVPLAGLSTAEDVAALGLAEQRELSLLVLDNCEHLLPGLAGVVHELVAGTPDLRILTTSRSPLGLSSEAVHQLPELSLPSCAELFRQRARAARPGVELPEADVAEVCRHLDGLPLAVELAAARVRTMSVAEIARRLDDRFGLLRGGARDAPERHHTLHAVVDWSWNLLDPAGRAAMRALSVFPGGFTAEAAHRVLGADPLAVLEQLADQSLLRVIDTPAGTRLRMLETVREFSAARLAEAGESGAVTTAFLGWAREFGALHHDAVFGSDPYGPVAAIRAEQDNLLQALRLALVRDDRPAVAAVTAVLGGLWSLESNGPRLAGLFRQTSWPLSHYRPEPGLVEATRTALTAAVLYTFGFEGPRPVRALVALRRLGPAAPDTVVRALGVVIAALGDPDALRRLCDSTGPLPAGVANMLASHRWEAAGDLDAALTAARRALVRFTDRDLPWLRALAHGRIAELLLQLEQGGAAREHLLATLPLVQRLGARVDAVGIRAWLVLASLQTGDTAEAERWLNGLAQVTLTEEQAESAGYDLAIGGEVLLARGEVEAGLRLWRRVAERAGAAGNTAGVPPELDPWPDESRSVAVVAHARHDRLDLVADVAAALPGRLAHLLAHPLVNPPPYLVEPAICGTLLLATGMAGLARARAAGGPERTRVAVRMIALAERFRWLRNFQPTMSTVAARADAERADRAAYREAASAYAGLDREALREAALELLVSGCGPGCTAASPSRTRSM